MNINKIMKLISKPEGIILMMLGVVATVMFKPLYFGVAEKINPSVLEDA